MKSQSPNNLQRSTIKVAIITATYNASLHIKSCIASVIAQTHANTWHVIVDGESADDTLSIISQCVSERIICVSEEDSGIYSAWNKGVKLINAEWSLFLGADDILLPWAVESLVSQASCSCDINLVSGVSLLLRPDGRFAGLHGTAYSRKILWHHMPISNCSTIYHQTLFTNDYIFNEELRSAADYGFLMEMRHQIKSKHLREVVSVMRLGGISNREVTLTMKESYYEKLRYYPRYSQPFLLLFYYFALVRYKLLMSLFGATS